MNVATGTHIGPYEIVGWLGAGGMSEVYRACDPRLGREVAIKVIPESLAMDSSRVRRFEQEARAAGQLNHPNILAVYDIGFHAGAPYIVSELLEGESLRSRLNAGALPPRKAIDYARQIAEGLAAAHDKGIVHRDVKPDNLFITNEGRVKILDFGIAKLSRPYDDTTRHIAFQTETAAGTVVGTAGYMSPEQVRGDGVDARSDIFSLGTVFYEMLTGRPSFIRGTAAETMAAILKEDPPEPLPANVPPAVGRIVSRCLEKTREARFQSARDLAFGLESQESLEALSGTPAGAAPSPAVVIPRRTRRWTASLPWAVAGALAFGLALALVRWAPWREVPPRAPLRLSVELGADAPLAFASLLDATILSPAGDVVAFAAQKQQPLVLPYDRFPGVDADPQLYVRRLDQLQAMPLPGTDGALMPFLSPDGQWIGFFSGGKLKKVAVTGGEVVTLSDAPNGRGGAWSEDGTIVFSPNQTRGTRLLRVSSAGGHAEPVAPLAEGEVIQLWPQVLPGGKAVLYTGGSIAGAYNDANLVVQALPDGARKVVQRGGYHGRYVPSGHLVYMHDGTLFAAPFDLDRLEVTGQPVPALEGVTSNATTGSAQFAVSAGGTLVYLPGQSFGAGAPLNWMDQEGKTTPLRVSPRNWFNILFAPDGLRLAMEIHENTSDIWIYQFAQDTLTRLTFEPAGSTKPVWTPDRRRIAFASARADKSTPNLYWQGYPLRTSDAQRLTESKNAQEPASWHPTGRFLAFEETTPQTNVDLMILPMEGDETSGWKPGKPTVFLNSPFREAEPMFSPDGRWIAYSSNESGREEVYVRPFPGPGGKWQISAGGGSLPTWSRTKHELFYGRNGEIMIADFTVEGAAFRAGKPRLWSKGRYQLQRSARMFDLHPDGERFALAPAALIPSGAKLEKVVFNLNFFDELRRIAPAIRR